MKAIESWDVIKHDAFMDVAFEVEYAVEYTNDIMVTGYWYNQGFEKSWMLPYYRNSRARAMGQPSTQTFFIKRADLHKWSKVINPRKDVACLRKCDWEKCA